MKRSYLGFLAVAVAVLVSAVCIPTIGYAANAGYDGKFFIQNDDETFKLKIGGGIRNKFYYNKATGSPSTLSFQLRGLWLNFDAEIHKNLTLGMDLYHQVTAIPNANPNFGTVNIAGATIDYKVIPEFIVSVGMVGLPLDISSGRLLTEYPLVTWHVDSQRAYTPMREAFGAPDGLGMWFSGDIWNFGYEVGVINGSESNYAVNPNKKFDAGARFYYNVLGGGAGGPSDFSYSETPKLTLSLGGVYQCKRDITIGTAPTTSTGTLNYMITGSGGARVQWKGLSFTGQGYYRKYKFGTIPAGSYIPGSGNLTDVGYYAGLGYFVLPKRLELAGQFSQVFRQGPDNDSWQGGGGVNWYIIEQNLLLQLDYTLTVEFNDGSLTGGENPKDHTVALQLTAKF